MTTPRIYLSPPELTGNELGMLGAAIASGWIAPLGPHVDAFEAETARRVEMPHALALSSGTAALHLALLVLGVGRGDTVWTSTLTFAATSNAIAYTGAAPVFVDSDRASWNLDPGLVVDALDRAARTNTLPKALVGVDLYGQCADWEPIIAACRRHGVWIVEDAAEALGASYHGKPAGSLGDLATLSFNGNKIITTSGGGMLLGTHKAWLDRARHLATQAREPVRHYEHKDIGYNYRLSNILAALGVAQMERLDAKVARRREHRAAYEAGLGDLHGIGFMPVAAYGEPSHWLTVMTVDADAAEASVGDVLSVLGEHGLEARPAWKPLHLQPVFADREAIGGAVAERIFDTGMCLPSGSSLTDAERDEVVAVVRQVLG